MLELKNISVTMNGEPYLRDITVSLPPNKINILLGATLSGKTTLMYVIAGLQKTDGGAIYLNGNDITHTPVQKRQVAMVYQQFVNYPTMTVLDNIASPLVAAKMDKSAIRRRVEETAELLRLTPFLQRKPSALSGGQQQRVALARALAKDADIVLLDEPLANLDYKLREELREEMPRLFAERNSVVVYATTDPTEALLLGDNSVALHEGEIVQMGAAAALYRQPNTLRVAEIFSDPPLNIARARKKNGILSLITDSSEAALPSIPLFAGLADGDYHLAFRAHHLRDEKPDEVSIAFDGVVQIAEIAGSESFVHLTVGGHNWVMRTTKVALHKAGSPLACYIRPQDLMIFDNNQRRLSMTPQHGKNHGSD